MSSATRSTPATQGYFLMSNATNLNTDLSYALFTLSDTSLAPTDPNQVFVLADVTDISADIAAGLDIVLKDFGQTVYGATCDPAGTGEPTDMRRVSFVNKALEIPDAIKTAGLYVPLGVNSKGYVGGVAGSRVGGLKSGAALIGSL